MRRNYFRLLEGLLFSLPLLFASCGNGDNALEEIINGGGSGGGSSSTNTYRVYTSGTAYTDEAMPEGTIVTSSLATWPAGTYIVNSDVTIDYNVSITGDVKLIVYDGVTLKVNGHFGETYGTETCSLSIFGQSAGTGKIIATCTTADMPTIDAKEIIIHGVVINASSTGNDGKAIYANDNLVVYNSDITASATVGGGAQTVETLGDLKIYNGTIVISGMSQGIMANNTYVYGGDITASAGNQSSGEGGVGISGTLNISGGTVKANGGDATIADQKGGCAIDGTLVMNGGNVTATGGNGNGTFGGAGINGALTVDGGTLIANGGDGDGTYGGAGISGAATFNGGTITAKGIKNSAINAGGAININDGITSVTLISTDATADPAASSNWIAVGSGSLSFGGTDISGGWCTSVSFADPEASHQYGTTTIAIERDGTSLILTKYVP